MEDFQIKTDEVYTVNHRRKGTFKLHVTDQNDTWVTGIVIEGIASGVYAHNDKYPDEEITIRKFLCSFSEYKS